MLLRVYSNRFLRNHTEKVVPRVFRNYLSRVITLETVTVNA